FRSAWRQVDLGGPDVAERGAVGAHVSDERAPGGGFLGLQRRQEHPSADGQCGGGFQKRASRDGFGKHGCGPHFPLMSLLSFTSSSPMSLCSIFRSTTT